MGRSLTKLIKDKPATGWMKADSLPSQETTQEIRELKGQVTELKRALKTVRTTAPKETAPLAQGEDQFEIEYTFHAYGGHTHSDSYSASYSMSWAQIFLRIAPLMVDEALDKSLKEELNRMTEEANIKALRKEGASKYPRRKDFEAELYRRFNRALKHPRREKFDPWDFQITPAAFDAIKVQLVALKLIKKNRRKVISGFYEILWTLTPHGLIQMAELRAIRKTDSEKPAPSPSKRATRARRSD